jgi:hypothetical protein
LEQQPAAEYLLFGRYKSLNKSQVEQFGGDSPVLPYLLLFISWPIHFFFHCTVSIASGTGCVVDGLIMLIANWTPRGGSTRHV